MLSIVLFCSDLPSRNNLSANFIAGTIWTSNLIGIVFARSLHYQFYCWHFHSLPFLLWQSPIPTPISAALLLGIEISFNVFPSTWWSSLLLQCCHLVLLVSVYLSSIPKHPIAIAEDKAIEKTL